MNKTRIHLEDSPLFKVIPEEHRIEVDVPLPPLATRTDGEQKVFTYPACWLALHALSRMLDAEQTLEDNRHHHQPRRGRTEAKAHARTEWLLALLELSHLFRFYNAYLDQVSAPPVYHRFVTLVNVAKVAQEHTPALAQLGQPDLFHRIFASLKQRKDRGKGGLNVAEPILDGDITNCGTALSEFLRDKCKIDPVSPAHSAWYGSPVEQAEDVLDFLARKVSHPGVLQCCCSRSLAFRWVIV